MRRSVLRGNAGHVVPGCTASSRALSQLVTIALLLVGTTHVARATVYEVGAGKPFATLADLPELSNSDVVEISSGRYNEVKLWGGSGSATEPITIRGVGNTRPLIDADGLNVGGVLPHPRAAFQVEGNHIVIENLEFANARNGNGNGAGIRVRGMEDPAINVTIRGCYIHDCDMGIQGGDYNHLIVENSEIAANGTSNYDGRSHNFYLGGKRSTVRYCYIHDSTHGQNFKSRGHYTELLYNLIVDSQDGEVGLVDADETASANSNAVMIGNVVVSKPRLSAYNNSRFVWFGEDMGRAHNGVLYVFNNTFIAGDVRISFLRSNTSGASIVASNNIFFGSDGISDSGPITGSSNWVSTGASIPSGFTATVTGTVPGFVGGDNYRLDDPSDCANEADPTVTYRDGEGREHSGVPTEQYVDAADSGRRVDDGYLDIGAYESITAQPRDGGADGDTSDGGLLDGGPLGDSGGGDSDGARDESVGSIHGGCSCNTVVHAEALVLLGLLVVRRSRKTRRSQPDDAR